MIHCYKFDDLNIVLDTYSGSIHMVDPVAFDIIQMFEDTPREEILSSIMSRYGDDPTVTEEDVNKCMDDIQKLKDDGKIDEWFVQHSEEASKL